MQRNTIEEIEASIFLADQAGRLAELTLQLRLKRDGLASVLRSRDMLPGITDLRIPQYVADKIDKTAKEQAELINDRVQEIQIARGERAQTLRL